MASQAQLVEIANNFLLNAPPGEFMEVVTDVRALIPQESMLNASAPTTFKRYNEDQMVQADSEDKSHRFLITHYAELGTNEYIDHAGGVVATFDHIKQVVVSSRFVSAHHKAAKSTAQKQQQRSHKANNRCKLVLMLFHRI